MMPEQHIVLEGYLSIQAALESNSREIHHIYIQKKKKYDQQLARLRRLAQAQGTPVEYAPDELIHNYAQGKGHGGVIALAGERRFSQLEQLIVEERAPFIVMLDGVEDPYNLGYAIRALYAAGADGLITRSRGWISGTTVVVRASAGTSEQLPIAVSDSPEMALEFFRSEGLKIVAAAKNDRAVSLYEIDLSVPLFLIVGGERRGVARALRGQVDILAQIPYGRDFAQSMGTVAATAAIAFEVMRQRMDLRS